MTHQANVRTICRPLTTPKGGDRYFIGFQRESGNADDP